MNRKQKKVLIRITVSVTLMIVSAFLPIDGLLRFAVFMLPYLTVGYDILIKAVKGIFRGKPFDENFLMAVATVGAIILGDYVEGCAVMLFYQIGELFQSCAVGKSRRSISELMDIRPDYANIEDENGELCEVDPDEIEAGSIIVIKVGERVPIDGIVVEGSTSLDTAALTGESIPREIRVGDEVVSGCVNMSGVIKIRTTKRFEESTASRILDLVENASSKKSRPENFISKFAKYYTPTVCLSALVLALVPPIVSIIIGASPEWKEWVYRALTFLVISCPCALVISIPLTFFAGIGGASNAGVLVKGSNYFESLSKIKCVVFDKTGTLTKGKFSVSQVFENNVEKDKLIEYAALAEYYSTHPISESLRAECAFELDPSRISDSREIGGQGIVCTVDGHEVAVGNRKLMSAYGIEPENEDICGTVVYVAIDSFYSGRIVISDTVKPTSRSAIEGLKALGVKRTVMLTGDSASVGKRIAEELSIDDAHCELLPQDKVSIVEALMDGEFNGKTAFVGDGINDAPVLTRADVGIAMGALGSDSAIEAADVVLMDDDPSKLVKAIKIARKCLRIVYQNIYFAIGIKLVCLLLGAVGYANMWFAIFADVGVMVIAVLNAIRALNVKKL